MAAEITTRPDQGTALEQVLISGDLKSLTPEQRVMYYHRVCDSVGLNPLTQPFAYITLNGKLTLYALKGCTDQLRAARNVSVSITSRELVNDVYVVTARASTPDGRTDESIGAVPVAGLKGEALANAYMKAESKSKRRVTLSLCGLGMLDESEVDSIPGAQRHALETPRADVVRETITAGATELDLRQQVNEAINALADATDQPLTELVPIVMADAGIKGKNGKTMTDEERQRVLDVIQTRLDSLALSSDAPVAETMPAEEERF